jgi:thymidylate synthase (FAD)
VKADNPRADRILDFYYPVHDHGFVALLDYMGDDKAIENAARQSFGAQFEDRGERETVNIIRYMRGHEHTSPFEMVELKFHCAMPIFVARQWIRHRTANVNEYSGRYSKMPNLFYSPSHEQVCYQSKTNNQGRAEQVSQHDFDVFKVREKTRRLVAAEYEWALEHDFAREIARIDLPLSTYTQWQWKIDLHNLMHFLWLRVNPAAQWEIRQYALIMAAMVREVAPIAFQAWCDFKLNSVSFSWQERKLLDRMWKSVSWGKDEIVEWGKLNGMSARLIDEFNAKLEMTEIEIPDIASYPVRETEHFAQEWKS